jgi:hypothetical protein
MTTETHFGFPVKVSQCDPSLYKLSGLERAVHGILELPGIVNRPRGGKYDLHLGRAESSEVLPIMGPERLMSAAGLVEWIRAECRAMLGVEEVVIDRSSINRMHHGSEMLFHQHLGVQVAGLEKPPALVAVFYLVAPEFSGELVLAKHSAHGRRVMDHYPNELIAMTPKEGQLVIHPPALWHAVSVHRSVTPRICFAFHVSAATRPA